MNCPSCGQEVGEYSVFCPRCGEPIDVEEANAEEESLAAALGDWSETTTSDEAPLRDPVLGCETNVASALSYLLWFVTGLVFYLRAGDNEFVRYHAAQSIVVFGGLFALGSVTLVVLPILRILLPAFLVAMFGWIVSIILFLAGVATLVLWLGLMYTAFEGQHPRIPIASRLARRLV